MINQAIKNLVEYAVKCDLITTEDKVYTTNRILEILNLMFPPNKICTYIQGRDVLCFLFFLSAKLTAGRVDIRAERAAYGCAYSFLFKKRGERLDRLFA